MGLHMMTAPRGMVASSTLVLSPSPDGIADDAMAFGAEKALHATTVPLDATCAEVIGGAPGLEPQWLPAAAWPPRHRRRARTEPESEPDVPSGASDSEGRDELALTPQFKRLRLS